MKTPCTKTEQGIRYSAVCRPFFMELAITKQEGNVRQLQIYPVTNDIYNRTLTRRLKLATAESSIPTPLFNMSMFLSNSSFIFIWQAVKQILDQKMMLKADSTAPLNNEWQLVYFAWPFPIWNLFVSKGTTQKNIHGGIGEIRKGKCTSWRNY